MISQHVTQQLLQFGGEPIAFIGDPKRCVGLVQVHNPHPHAVKLKRLRLRSSMPLPFRCDGPDQLEIKLAASFCSGETQQLRVKLQLPAGTPPGCYDAQLEGADGVLHSVAIHVLEARRVRISPARLVVSHASGASFDAVATVSNLGNVPVVVPPHAALELHEAELGWTHQFHAAAKAHADEGFTPFADAFVKKLGQSEPGLGRVKVVEGSGALAPQQSRKLELHIGLPKKLRSGGKYTAIARIAETFLRLTVHVAAADETSSVAG